MKKLTLSFIFTALFLSAALSVNAQRIETNRFASKEECFKRFPELNLVNLDNVPLIVRSPNEKEVAKFREMKRKSRLAGGGYVMDVKLGMSDGIWTEVDGKRIWTLCLASPLDADMLGVHIRNFRLASDAQMYIYSQNGKHVMVYNGMFNVSGNLAAHVENSETMVIQIIEPANSKETSTLEIVRFVYTPLSSLLQLLSQAESLDCHRDVACEPDWKKESYGVCKIITHDNSVASGSLLNNTRENYIPYILTAFHVLDEDDNGTLSTEEKANLIDCKFTFHYKAKDCNGSVLMKEISFTGAEFRAAYQPTDFALAELTEFPVVMVDSLTFLGWDKRSTAPSFGTTINHPGGDIMKIAWDATALTAYSNTLVTESGLSYPAGSMWAANLDVGTTEGGSSGGPLFDANHRVRGYVHGHPSAQTDRCASLRGAYFGRFDKSWTGGNTNDTRLSNWLDPANTGQNTTDSKYLGELLVDLSVQDNASDLGAGASVGDVTASPAVTILNANDNTPAQYIEAEEDYIIRVKVYNRTQKKYYKNANLIVNWQPKTTAQYWRNGWLGNTTIDCDYSSDVVFNSSVNADAQNNIPEIAGNGNYGYVNIPWTAPSTIRCLADRISGRFGNTIGFLAGYKMDINFLVRIHDGFTITGEFDASGMFSTNYPLDPFVRQSNNVALYTTSYLYGSYAKIMSVQTIDRYSLKFELAKTAGKSLLDYAELYIVPTDKLFEEWKTNGINGNGIKLTDRGVLITSPNAVISNIPLTSEKDEDEVFALYVNFLSAKTPENSEFSFNIIQSKDGKNTGTVNYIAVRNPDRYFAVQAHAEAQLTEKSLILTADPLGEPAKYIWYNAAGKDIGSEREIEIELPKTSQWYKLEVIADADHYKDYDSVFVNIPAGFIASISPNPAKSEVLVKYFLADYVENGTLLIYNNLGNLFVNQPVSSSSTETVISLSGFPVGTYSVVIVANGVPADSKPLIKN